MKVLSQKEYRSRIEGYGFVYQPSLSMLRLGLWLLAIIVFAVLFDMHPVLLAITLGMALFIVPLCYLWEYEYLYEQRIFKEFTMMLQHLIASFKIHPKMKAAIEEVKELCSGEIRQDLEEVLRRMEQGQDYASSMESLEEKYPFFVLENLSCLMVMVEQFGARKYHEGLDLIQDDLDAVIEDTYLHQQELMQTRNKIYVLCLLALAVGLMAKRMLDGLFSFAMHPGYQFALFLFSSSLILTLVLAQKSMRHSWLSWRKEA